MLLRFLDLKCSQSEVDQPHGAVQAAVGPLSWSVAIWRPERSKQPVLGRMSETQSIPRARTLTLCPSDVMLRKCGCGPREESIKYKTHKTVEQSINSMNSWDVASHALSLWHNGVWRMFVGTPSLRRSKVQSRESLDRSLASQSPWHGNLDVFVSWNPRETRNVRVGSWGPGSWNTSGWKWKLISARLAADRLS
jgi:hypothetical protein